MATSLAPVLSGPTALLVSAIEAQTGLPARRAGRELLLRCPVHGDHKPSANVREGDGGYPIFVCRSQGCTTEQALEALGLTWGDIFGDDNDRWTPRGPYTAIYDYEDEEGRLLFQVCRTADKQFPARRPNPEKPKGWEWSLNGTRRVPFRLPQVIAAAKAGEEVWVAEGERDVLALEKQGRVATTGPGGAGKWRPEFGPYFRGAHVLVVADDDQVGLQHARAVAESLSHFAASVRLLRPKEGKDVSDHLAAGLTLDALVPFDLAEADRELTALADDAQLAGEAADEERGAPRLRFLPGNEFRKQPLSRIEPLVGVQSDALMMPGSLVLLAGIGGSGKTTLALHAMAHWSAGLCWFGVETARPLKIVIIENEGPHDPFARKVDDFVDRFTDCPCCDEPHGESFGIDENCHVLDAPWGKFSFDDEGLAHELREFVLETEADLVVANPLGRLGMRGAGAPEETRAFLDLLYRAGLGEDFAALLVHHMAKANPQMPLIQQISGDWGPHPDTILVMEPAGERRSKLSFGKVRWGDQGRSPLILDWLVDPEGPIGYKVQGQEALSVETREKLRDRLEQYLSGQNEPVSITAIKTAVRGKASHLVSLVQEGIESGRYQTSGTRRVKYWLTAGAGMPEPLLLGGPDA